MICDICGSEMTPFALFDSVDWHCFACGAVMWQFTSAQAPDGHIATVLIMPNTRALAAEIRAKREAVPSELFHELKSIIESLEYRSANPDMGDGSLDSVIDELNDALSRCAPRGTCTDLPGWDRVGDSAPTCPWCGAVVTNPFALRLDNKCGSCLQPLEFTPISWASKRVE